MALKEAPGKDAGDVLLVNTGGDCVNVQSG